MIYSFLRVIAAALLNIVFRLEVYGLNEVPAEGPAIIAANHKSWIDPVAIGVVLKRRVCFMAKEELFRIPVFSALLRQLYAFPVKRSAADVKALKNALRLLRNNELLGIFVEGTRVKTGGIGEIKPGVYALARLSGAPVILCAIRGTRPIFVRCFPPIPNKIRLVFKRFEADPLSFDQEDYLRLLKHQLEGLYHDA